MSAQVLFSQSLDKATNLFSEIGFNNIIAQNDLVAVKVHFGERGNNAYVKPARITPIISKIKEIGGRPFLTDANTIYRGSRSDAVVHLQTAFDHGFTYDKVGAPVIIADGLSGHSFVNVKVNLKHFQEVSIGSIVLEAQALVVLTHFKGHEVTGFGGALKNIGMGLGCRSGKQQMHADLRPVVNQENCTGCQDCLNHCPTEAITMTNDNKAFIDLDKCIGCGECIASCRFQALNISWNGSPSSLQEKIVEYAAGALVHFKNKVVYLTYITDVSPNCDCWDHNEAPIVPDLGVLASLDPVALDQACLDLVNRSPEGRIKGNSKFKTLWPDVDHEIQLNYAEEIGLGSRQYKLVVK